MQNHDTRRASTAHTSKTNSRHYREIQLELPLRFRRVPPASKQSVRVQA